MTTKRRFLLESSRDMSLDELRKEFVASKVDGSSARETDRLITRVAEKARWTRLRHVNAKGLRDFLKLQQREGRSVRTRQATIVALRDFGSWLGEQGYASRNPFESVKRIKTEKVKQNQTFLRREMSREEWDLLSHWLLGHGKGSRWLLYATALETGFRKSELGRIRREHCNSMRNTHS